MKTLPTDLLLALKMAYEPCELPCRDFVPEKESEEYYAYDFQMDHNGIQRAIKYRIAKITPTKVGQFVTLWKRIGKGPIMPFEGKDPFDFYVVSVRDGKNFGQFVFPKQVLLKQGVLSKGEQEGKRAIRVYPPWDVTESPQAKTTQKWQTLYFFKIEPFVPVDKSLIQKLFNCKTQ